MTEEAAPERIACPCCGSADFAFWAEERGFDAVRCAGCRLIYVNPRPPMASIDEGVRLGEHRINGEVVNVKARPSRKKVKHYEAIFSRLFGDRLNGSSPLIWVDFGAGYGEIVEAVRGLAPAGSEVAGVEPMAHKVAVARADGHTIVEGYPQPGAFQADIVSMVNIFSHVPDFQDLLRTAVSNLRPGGELFIETGNLADLDKRAEFYGILDLPDHLVFSGEPQIALYLAAVGFRVTKIERQRTDGLVNFAKTLAKKLLGRPVRVQAPYSSRYRQLLIRAAAAP